MDKDKELIKNGKIGNEKMNTIGVETVRIEKKRSPGLYIGFLIIIIAGSLSGYFLAQSKKPESAKGGIIDNKKVVGSTDMKIFKDSAEGTLEKGGIDGEGTHKLVRPGGESQTVYLTSSVVDLDQFVGKKVKVAGETLAAQKAGWFMDVGRVEIIQ